MTGIFQEQTNLSIYLCVHTGTSSSEFRATSFPNAALWHKVSVYLIKKLPLEKIVK